MDMPLIYIEINLTQWVDVCVCVCVCLCEWVGGMVGICVAWMVLLQQHTSQVPLIDSRGRGNENTAFHCFVSVCK